MNADLFFRGKGNAHGLGASGTDRRGLGGVVVSVTQKGVERGTGRSSGRIMRNRNDLNRVGG